MDTLNITNVTLTEEADEGIEWIFAGIIVFKISSFITSIINIIAFAIIYNNEKCFGKNGFREQLLILCVNDSLSGLTFFLLTFCLERTCTLKYMYPSALAFMFCQFTSYGNTLGIALQRFMATRRAGETRAGWSRKYTAVYLVVNIIIMTLLILAYVGLNVILDPSYSNLLFLVVISICVITTDTLCCLTLYYLYKNMRIVSSAWMAGTRNGSMPSARTAILDAPQPSVTIGISFIKSKQTSDDDPQSSDETDYGKVSQKSQWKNKLDTLSIPQVSRSQEDSGTKTLSTADSWARSRQRDSLPPDPTEQARQKLNRFGRYQRDAGLTVAIVVLLLNLFTFVPVLVSVITRIAPDLENLAAYRAVILFFSVNSLINPFVYVFRMKNLEARLVRTVKAYCRRWFPCFR